MLTRLLPALERVARADAAVEATTFHTFSLRHASVFASEVELQSVGRYGDAEVEVRRSARCE